MGAARSKITRYLTSTIQTEARMHKIIEREKPTQAPRHPSATKAFRKMIEDNPMLQDVDKTKNTEYLKMLTDFKVDSTDPAENIKLPSQTSKAFFESTPAKIPRRKENRSYLPIHSIGKRTLVPGKVTANQLLELFAKRRTDPDEWTDKQIAQKYHIDESVVSNLFQYYGSFNIIREGKPPGPLETGDVL